MKTSGCRKCLQRFTMSAPPTPSNGQIIHYYQKLHITLCNLCNTNTYDTCTHLLSPYPNGHIISLCTIRHNKRVCCLATIWKSQHAMCCDKHTHEGHSPNFMLDNNVVSWLLLRTCFAPQCWCLTRLWPNALHVHGIPLTPLFLFNPHIQFIEYTYDDDCLSDTTIANKVEKYITVGVRGAICNPCIQFLNNLPLPISNNKSLVNSLHPNTFKYLALL